MGLTCEFCGKQLADLYWHKGIVVVEDKGEFDWKHHKRFCNEECLFKYLLSKQSTKPKEEEGVGG